MMMLFRCGIIIIIIIGASVVSPIHKHTQANKYACTKLPLLYLVTDDGLLRSI